MFMLYYKTNLIIFYKFGLEFFLGAQLGRAVSFEARGVTNWESYVFTLNGLFGVIRTEFGDCGVVRSGLDGGLNLM